MAILELFDRLLRHEVPVIVGPCNRTLPSCSCVSRPPVFMRLDFKSFHTKALLSLKVLI